MLLCGELIIGHTGGIFVRLYCLDLGGRHLSVQFSVAFVLFMLHSLNILCQESWLFIFLFYRIKVGKVGALGPLMEYLHCLIPIRGHI